MAWHKTTYKLNGAAQNHMATLPPITSRRAFKTIQNFINCISFSFLFCKRLCVRHLKLNLPPREETLFILILLIQSNCITKTHRKSQRLITAENAPAVNHQRTSSITPAGHMRLCHRWLAWFALCSFGTNAATPCDLHYKHTSGVIKWPALRTLVRAVFDYRDSLFDGQPKHVWVYHLLWLYFTLHGCFITCLFSQ